MKRAVIILLAGLSLAACGEAPTGERKQTAVVTPATAAPTTTTTAAPTTTTTACVDTSAADRAALDRRIAAEQSAVDQMAAAGRDMESAIAQVQLVIDEAARKIAASNRYLADVQADYDHAQTAYDTLRLDSYKDKLDYQAGRLADAKDIVASWQDILVKAQGDLGRDKTTAAASAGRLKDAQALVAADRQAMAALTPSC